MSSAAPKQRARSAATSRRAASREEAGARRADVAELLDGLPFAVLTVSCGLVVQDANREAERMLGLRDPARGSPLPEPWRELSLRRFARARCGREAIAAELRAQVDGGRIVELSGLPTPAGALLVLRDVTVRAREDRSEQAFVANAAHELRASLGGISSAVEALELGAKDDPGERNRLLAGIDAELRRLRREVEALLVMSRVRAEPRTLPLERVHAAALVEDVAGALSPRAGVEIETDCDAAATVRAQRPLLEIALRNVARNAARHTRNGRITLSCRRVDGGRVALEVADDGPGIAPTRRAHLFERFAAADGEGFGIGLPLTHEIVQLLDGEVDVETDQGGTRVRLVLPAG